jgi:hypothetical protein
MGMSAGEILIDHEGNPCRADEFLPDGEVFVSYPDGAYATLKWSQVRKPNEMERVASSLAFN